MEFIGLQLSFTTTDLQRISHVLLEKPWIFVFYRQGLQKFERTSDILYIYGSCGLIDTTQI
jgi:hypothetical protein